MLWRTAALCLLLFVSVEVAAWGGGNVDALARALASEDHAERERAAIELGSLSTPNDRFAATPLLVRVLADPVASVRGAAAAALGRLEDARAASALAQRVGVERDADVLAAVLLALGTAGDERHVPLLHTVAITHASRSVRAAAVTGLGGIGGDAARRTVLGVLRAPGLPDPDWSLRAAAVLALVHCGRVEDVGTVLTLFREGGEQFWFARAALARLVTALDREPLPLLRRLARDPDPRVAVTAAVGIARVGHVEEMLVLLRHPTPTVRAAAASAVAREEVAGAYARLRSLARFDRSSRVRWACAMALFRLEEPVGDDYVLAGLSSREPIVWAEAIAALRNRTGESHGRDVNAWRRALRRWRRQ